MVTHFDKLNTDWNAEPNAPYPRIEVDNGAVTVRFVLNSYQFPRFSEDQEARTEKG
jgi:hypothetical protein